jgi:tetratricopeptide (TPR) repeat protein
MSETPIDQEPSAEFRDSASAVMKGWETGKINYEDAFEQLSTLSNDAANGTHIANHAYAELLQGVLRSYRANLDQGIRHFRTARDLFEQVGNKERVLLCDTNLGESYHNKGELERARGVFRKAAVTAKELNNVRSQVICLAQEGQVLYKLGKPQEALPLLQEAVQLSSDPSLVRDHILADICAAYADIALIYFERGETTPALENAQHALRIAEESNMMLAQGIANRVLGTIITLVKPKENMVLPTTNPDAFFAESLRCFREIKAEGQLANTTFAHGVSLARRRQKIEAATKFQEALAAYTRLGMAHEATKANDAYLRMIRDS